MTRIILAVFAALSFATASLAQDRGIEDTISSQLEAFTARDVEGAFSFASPMIQGLFATPDNFGMMVERGYPMVWDNAEVEFGDQQDMGGMILQRVYIRDASGRLHALEYAMIPGQDGWLIDGVQLLPAPEIGV